MTEPLRECPREKEVLAGVLAGDLPTEVARHAAGCAECREVVAVSTWLRGVARETLTGSLPAADRVWWRAQVERRLEERHAMIERAARPIRWFERGAVAAIALTVAGIVWSHALPTATVALTWLSEPGGLAGLTAALLAIAGLTARVAAQRP